MANFNNHSVSGYVFNHTMLRVKDFKRSVAFYEDILGFTTIYREDFDDDGFTIAYMAHVLPSDIPADNEECRLWALSQAGVLELTYNHGSEKDPDFHYHNGNDEPRGYGHICITVPDLQDACLRMQTAGVRFKKRPEEGRMRYVAFILDPDGYWIEILQHKAEVP